MGYIGRVGLLDSIIEPDKAGRTASIGASPNSVPPLVWGLRNEGFRALEGLHLALWGSYGFGVLGLEVSQKLRGPGFKHPCNHDVGPIQGALEVRDLWCRDLKACGLGFASPTCDPDI